MKLLDIGQLFNSLRYRGLDHVLQRLFSFPVCCTGKELCKTVTGQPDEKFSKRVLDY